jgi:hypothetical protein
LKELFAQITPDYSLKPVSEADKDALRNFRANQIVKVKVKGTTKSRSVLQNQWIHVIFKKTAENSRDPDWQTPEMVKRNVKMAMRFFKDEVIVHGNRVYFELRSFAFHEMEQSEANRVFSHAVEICAAHLGVEPETLKTESMR